VVLDRFRSKSDRVELTKIVEFAVKLKVWNLGGEKSTDLAIDISSVWRSKFYEVVDSLTVTYLYFHNIVVIIY